MGKVQIQNLITFHTGKSILIISIKFKSLTFMSLPPQDSINHISSRTSCLFKDEKKGIASIHPAWDLWFTTVVDSTEFHGFYSRHLVYQILNEKFLLEASAKFPEAFASNDPYAVLEAIRKTANLSNFPMPAWEGEPEESQDEANVRIFKDFYFAITDANKTKTLRLDLFRYIGEDKKKELEYKGGLLHAFKHFCIERKPISFRSEPVELPKQFEKEIVRCLFFEEPINVTKKHDDNLILEFDFKISEKKFKVFIYYNKRCDIYFLDSIRRG